MPSTTPSYLIQCVKIFSNELQHREKTQTEAWHPGLLLTGRQTLGESPASSLHLCMGMNAPTLLGFHKCDKHSTSLLRGAGPSALQKTELNGTQPPLLRSLQPGHGKPKYTAKSPNGRANGQERSGPGVKTNPERSRCCPVENVGGSSQTTSGLIPGWPTAGRCRLPCHRAVGSTAAASSSRWSPGGLQRPGPAAGWGPWQPSTEQCSARGNAAGHLRDREAQECLMAVDRVTLEHPTWLILQLVTDTLKPTPSHQAIPQLCIFSYQ